MKIHGIKIEHPFILLLSFLLADIIFVVWLEIFETSVFIDSFGFVLAVWLLGFLDKSWQA